MEEEKKKKKENTSDGWKEEKRMRKTTNLKTAVVTKEYAISFCLLKMSKYCLLHLQP